MGIDAITKSDDGTLVIPSNTQDWQDWVSATDTRNFLLQDPLLDWLDLYGERSGFQRDTELAGYDPRTDFTRFIFQKTRDFEAAVIAYLKTKTSVVTIASDPADARNLDKAKETFAAMEGGAPVIYQAVLWDPENRTYGVPDLLIRSDEVARLLPRTLSREEASEPAQDLKDASWHYRVIDIKFTTLDLLAGGELGNEGSARAYKGQLFIYNRALGRIQGRLPPVSHLMGRSWKQTIKGVTNRGDSCLEQLAPVLQKSMLRKGVPLARAVGEATDWVRRVRREGMNWSVLPEPTVPELRPNTGHVQDAPWSSAKRRIAEEIQDLTLLWQVGVDKRRDANSLGISRWSDPRCTAVSVGVSGPKTQPVLQAMLDINQSNDGPPVRPPRVTVTDQEWRDDTSLEFYVDFETVNDLYDDFSRFPTRGGQTMIFMIGCGHVEDGGWHYKCFTADVLDEESEAKIIDAWLAHVRSVRDRLAPTGGEPLMIHWSHAETSNLVNAYNAAVKRHPEKTADWSTPRWFDFLKQVVKEQPVVIRGAFGFGLKEFAQGMHRHGLIDTRWEEGPVDGLGATVGAWWSAGEASRQRVPLAQIELMRTIQGYNEVDCKVMMEIVRYLRQNH